MESKNTDQDRWVIEIMEGLHIPQEEEEEFFICMFNVPKELLATKPEAYIPHTASIGLYHHWRSDLYEMERYKLAVARRFQKRISGLKFERVAEELRKHDQQIRSCYDKYLDYTDEALAWLMALDAAFLLECLQFYVKQADEASSEVLSLGKVLDPTGRSASHNAVLRDLMMLENQIPLFLLQKLLEMQLGLSSEEKGEGRLCNLVRLACVQLSPFKYKLPDNLKLRIKERGHLLEVLYYFIVPDPTAANSGNAAKDGNEDEKKQDEKPLPDTAYIAQAFSLLWKVLSSLNVGPVRRLTDLPQHLLRGRAVQFVMKLPFCLLSTLKNLPVMAPLLGSSTADKDEQDNDGDAQSSVETPPTRDELGVPSVSDLYSA